MQLVLSRDRPLRDTLQGRRIHRSGVRLPQPRREWRSGATGRAHGRAAHRLAGGDRVRRNSRARGWLGTRKLIRFAGDFRIGETGFEPATARPPAGCATRLRHSPWPFNFKRATGIEPALEAWKASVQPQHFARKARGDDIGPLRVTEPARRRTSGHEHTIDRRSPSQTPDGLPACAPRTAHDCMARQAPAAPRRARPPHDHRRVAALGFAACFALSGELPPCCGSGSACWPSTGSATRSTARWPAHATSSARATATTSTTSSTRSRPPRSRSASARRRT